MACIGTWNHSEILSQLLQLRYKQNLLWQDWWMFGKRCSVDLRGKFFHNSRDQSALYFCIYPVICIKALLLYEQMTCTRCRCVPVDPARVPYPSDPDYVLWSSIWPGRFQADARFTNVNPPFQSQRSDVFLGWLGASQCSYPGMHRFRNHLKTWQEQRPKSSGDLRNTRHLRK